MLWAQKGDEEKAAVKGLMNYVLSKPGKFLEQTKSVWFPKKAFLHRFNYRRLAAENSFNAASYGVC
jgi:hypothetical protein